MKKIIDTIMAGGGIGMMLLACSIKAGKFGGEQFDFTSGETTIMIIAGMLLFLLASASIRSNRNR